MQGMRRLPESLEVEEAALASRECELPVGMTLYPVGGRRNQEGSAGENQE